MSKPRAIAVNVIAVLLMLPAGFLAFSSGLLAPGWAVMLLIGVWAAVAAVMLRARPWQRLCLPIAYYLFWYISLTLGDIVLGWTA